jgi:hypothetical protein
MKEPVTTSLHLLTFLTGFPGFLILVSSARAFRKGVLSETGRVAVVICALIGVGLCGFAIYLVILSSNVPAK